MTAALGLTDLAGRVDRLDLAAKVALLTGADFWSLPAEPAVGLRRLVMSDGPAGVRGPARDERSPSANVPSPTDSGPGPRRPIRQPTPDPGVESKGVSVQPSRASGGRALVPAP